MFFAGLVSKPLKTAENLVVRVEKRPALSPERILFSTAAQPSAAVEMIIIIVIVI